jgi:hypothetical protein
METEKKQTSWEWKETTMELIATMPKGTEVIIDITKLVPKENWITLKDNVKFVILYGVKQKVSDGSNSEDNETGRKVKMLAIYKKIVDNDLSRTSGIKQTATKKLDNVKAIMANNDLTPEQKNKAIMELIS